MKILVIDDQSIDRTLMQLLLEQRFPSAEITLYNEHDAIANAENIVGYDLVVCDRYLGPICGVEFVEDNKLIAHNKHVMIVSALSETAGIFDKDGFAEHLDKLCQLHDL